MPCHEVNEQSVICTSWREFPEFRENRVAKYMFWANYLLRGIH